MAGIEKPLRIIQYDSYKDFTGKEIPIKEGVKKVSLLSKIPFKEIQSIIENKIKETKEN